MIQRINSLNYNNSYVCNLKSPTYNLYVPRYSEQNADNVSFGGLKGDIATKGLKFLENIKSKLPHNVFVVSGPSGVGKDTIIREVLKQDSNAKKVVSYTTRKMRPNEVEGVDYHFISKPDFIRMDVNNEFFNKRVSAEGVCYGGTVKEIREKRMGGNVFVNMSADQADKLKIYFANDAKTIFIAPPSVEELTHRLVSRGTENQQQIEMRLKEGLEELHLSKYFDKVVINDKIANAVKDTQKYIKKNTKLSIKIVDSLIDVAKNVIKNDKK